jgi:hypothetical protein
MEQIVQALADDVVNPYQVGLCSAFHRSGTFKLVRAPPAPRLK